MEIYAVIAYSQYYPNSDNVKGMFADRDKAYEFLEEYKRLDQSSEGYSYNDYYEVIKYDVDMEPI